MSLRIGPDRTYVVRNIGKFLTQLENGETIYFGKNFSFDPDCHEFPEEQAPLLDFLRELHQVNSLDNNGYYYFYSGLYRDKYICLSDALVKRFFSVMGEKPFTAVLCGKTYPDMTVVRERIPISFLVKKEENDLSMEIRTEDAMKAITEDGSYILAENRIYQPPKDQIRSIMPFLQVMKHTGSRKLRFSREDREKFVSEVLPYARRVGDVEVSDSVNAMLTNEPLVSEVYFDLEGRRIKARVRFRYGETDIDPFDPNPRSPALAEGGRILVRDIDAERNVLDLLEQYSFLVYPYGVYLEDEDKIFAFFQTGLSRLQKAAAVFYSDDFKLIIREKTPFISGIRLSSETDLLEFSFDLGDINPSEVSSIFAALREKKQYYRLKDGTFLSLDNKELNGMAQIADQLDLSDKDLEQKTLSLPKYRALYLDQQLKDAGMRNVKTNSAFEELVRDIRNPGDIPVSVPNSLESTLRDYQKTGFKWLKALSRYGLGGILADDMGLGKTIQVLALLLSDKEEGCRLPSLIVVPTSLVYNWGEEVCKFAPELNVLTVIGTKKERRTLMKRIPAADLVITSYPLIRRDREEYKAFAFHYCIIDEAQHIKNPVSQSAKAVKSVRASRRFALTGTPMENSLTELWSIFDFIMPGYLFTHTKFMNTYERPIVKEQNKDAMKRLAGHIKPFVLRRLKTDVLKELPEKIETRMIAELTEDQKKIYLAYLAQARGEIAAEIDHSGYQRSQIRILAALTRLRQICCYPGVFLEDYRGESGKLLLLDEVLPDALSGGHRILLFSQFTSILKLIRERLERNRIHTFYLDGGTEAQERSKLVNRFNEGEGDIFLISLKAGGTGLNLTGADTVIHFDPWWNPAVEDQASDRAYRIGQRKAVHVMRLITKGTIEEKIEHLKEQKRNLTDAVIKPGETFVSGMTEKEVMSLFE